ncbi:hypothetical protein P1P68_05970 [Streptomyces scabiei]|uniref:hypothetical protein n=1 Tax=Streptomyces scabiei TaxID=1930 RepID=UPI00298F8532|nr:hypothetical protein [Streptomyces scabiei]MDW8804349.1 hypothetical protein [Streptomyces scabiei]
MEVQQHMAAKQRRSRQVQARETAREKAARFREQEDERLRIAEEAILLQEEIADFDAETERRVAKLREERSTQLAGKRQKLDALVVEMLDTEIPAQQASERLGMSVGQVRVSKKNFDQMVAALAVQDANPSTVGGASPVTASPTAGGDDPTTPGGDQSPTETYSFPRPDGPATVPAQDGSHSAAAGDASQPGAVS